MPAFRIAPLAAAVGALLGPSLSLAQNEKEGRSIPLDKDITVRVAPLWSSRTFASGPTKLELSVIEGSALRMVVYFTVEKRRSPSDAVQRAAEIAGPPDPEDRLFRLDGWPAVEATRTFDLPEVTQEKESRDEKELREPEREVPTYDRTMTAVAAGDRILIVEQRLFDLADSRLREAGRAAVDGVQFTRDGDEGVSKRLLDDITFVRTRLFERRGDLFDVRPDWEFFRDVRALDPVNVQTGIGEIAMAASHNGARVAIVTNSGWGSSSDFGVTYTGGNVFPASVPAFGDPSLAYGGRTDNFYLGYIGQPNGSGGAGNTISGCTATVDRSKNGQTYSFAGHARTCAATVTAGQPLCLPDQGHVASNPARVRARGTRPLTLHDQVYFTWRQFTMTSTAQVNACINMGRANSVVELSCSSDSGATWSNPIALAAGSDYGRVAVGPDGFLYLVYSVQQKEKNGTIWNQVYLDKYSPCRQGLVHQWGYPRTVVANAHPGSCGASIPGLDRCDGRLLNSHTVTVSNFEKNGVVFIVYTDGTFNGSDRVIAAIAPDGGFNVTTTKLLSDGTPGRKFMPWACAEGRNLYATWYDRRVATTPATVDRTDFMAGWLHLGQYGIFHHRNINLTGNPDPQCASGWPQGTEEAGLATGCPTPQTNAGRCRTSTGTLTGLCDLASPSCPAGSTCQTSRGAPKYGDYNACACAGGRLFTAWTSATAPSGLSGSAGGLTTFTRTVVPNQSP